MRILVVDDDAELRQLACKMLEAKGHDVDALPSGFGVVNRLAGRGDEPAPELLVLDYLMPALNGAQILELIGKDDVARRVPVIVFSALSRDSIELPPDGPAVTQIVTKGRLRDLTDAVDALGPAPDPSAA